MIGAPRPSLRWRVALAFGVGSLLLTGVLATVTWNVAAEQMVRARETGATRLAELNVRPIGTTLATGDDGLEGLLTGDSAATVLLQRADGWTTSGRQVLPEQLPPALLALDDEGVPVRQRMVLDGVPVLAAGWSGNRVGPAHLGQATHVRGSAVDGVRVCEVDAVFARARTDGSFL